MSGFLSQYGPRKPKPHKETHEDNGNDELTTTGLAGRVNIVFRGVQAAVDFDRSSLSVNATWTDLDLSSIVPAGALAVLIQCGIYATAVNQSFKLRLAGVADYKPSCDIRVSNTAVTNFAQCIIPCSASRHLDYYVSGAAVTYLSLVVGGWLI